MPFNRMKSLISDYNNQLRLGGTAKSGIQKTRIRGGDLGYLHGRPRRRSDLAGLLADTPSNMRRQQQML